MGVAPILAFSEEGGSMFSSSENSEIARLVACSVAVVFSFGVAATEAHAETRVFGCNFVDTYSSDQVNSALSQARMAVGLEAISLYRQYLSLKNECRTNPSARVSVRLSPAMVALISK
jgi:hypothetical protein